MVEFSNRATNAPYTIYDGASQVGSPVLVNQELAPTADHVEGGEPFQILAGSVTITSGTLVVELSNAANEYVIADAVRIELVSPADLMPPPRPQTSAALPMVTALTLPCSTRKVISRSPLPTAEMEWMHPPSTVTNFRSVALVWARQCSAVGRRHWSAARPTATALPASFVDGSVDVDFVERAALPTWRAPRMSMSPRPRASR